MFLETSKVIAGWTSERGKEDILTKVKYHSETVQTNIHMGEVLIIRWYYTVKMNGLS